MLYFSWSQRKEDINVTNNILNQANNDKRTYSVTEVAQILGVSKKSVYNLCAKDAFKTVRIGSALRISKISFDMWLDGNR